MSADTLHRILLGELQLGKALSGGLLKVKGPILKTLPLSELFHQGQRYYPDVLRELGLTKRRLQHIAFLATQRRQDAQGIPRSLVLWPSCLCGRVSGFRLSD